MTAAAARANRVSPPLYPMPSVMSKVARQPTITARPIQAASFTPVARHLARRTHSDASSAPTSRASTRVSVRTASWAQKTPVSQRWARQTATATMAATMMAATLAADSRGPRKVIRIAGQSR